MEVEGTFDAECGGGKGVKLGMGPLALNDKGELSVKDPRKAASEIAKPGLSLQVKGYGEFCFRTLF